MDAPSWMVCGRFKAGQDEEEAWVGVLQSSIASVVALPADAVLGLSNYLRLLDQVLVTGGPSACKQPAISLPWGRGSRHSTTIAAGDTVQWVWADDEVHSIADQKVGNSSLAGYMGMGSGNLTLPRSRTCSSANTEGLSIEQLPPAPCALVVTLPGDISLKLRNYLSLLDAVIVTGGNNVCDTVDVTLPWRTGLKHNTTITAGDTVQWGWADDDVHSIRELKITNGPYAEYQGVGSGRLMVSRSTRCNSLNSGGQNITELPPVPCAVTPTEVQGADLQFSFTWTFDTPGTYYYECGRVATQAVGQITVLPRVASDVVEGASPAPSSSSPSLPE
eukprot:jgi/Mesen1/8364/ME000464S07770